MRVLSAIHFFPRGGSSHVARALALELPAHGCDVRLLSGHMPGGPGDAVEFYAGIDVIPVDFTAGDAPLHGSYEDRPGAPDVCMAQLGEAAYAEQVDAWCGALEAAGAADADVLHLHHLTVVNEAAARVAPGVPVVGHLHGTEMLMLEAIRDGAAWPHGDAWAARLRRWARRCATVIVPTPGQVERATRLLGVAKERCVVIPNGVDPDLFAPDPSADRVATWAAKDVELPPDATIVISVGRFTAVKRLGLLVKAFAEADRRDAHLVLVGGHPGELEGVHPLELAQRAGIGDRVHHAGWHPHDALPELLNAADVLALASVREQFGLVLVEAMACGLPVIAVDRLGPAEIVDDGLTGWLVPPDDVSALARAIGAAVDDPEERARRGATGRDVALRRYGWPSVGGKICATLREAVSAAEALDVP